MSYFKFKPNNFDAHLVLWYDFNNSKKNITIRELNIFKTDIEAQKFIKNNQLKENLEGGKLEQQIINRIGILLTNYFQGELADVFSKIKSLNVNLDLDSKFTSPFSKKVMNEIIKIKPGETTSYSEIGKKIGSKAYRAIGNACKSNPIPLIIPCHRILRKNGEIGGFMGKSDKAWETDLKRELLKLEGVRF